MQTTGAITLVVARRFERERKERKEKKEKKKKAKTREEGEEQKGHHHSNMDITLSYWWGDPLNVSGKGRSQSELRSCVKVEVAAMTLAPRP